MRFYITHSHVGLPVGDWSLDDKYESLKRMCESSLSGTVTTVTSSMLFILRLRVAVVENGLELFVRFGPESEYQRVNPDGTLDDWTGAYDVALDMLTRLKKNPLTGRTGSGTLETWQQRPAPAT